MASGWFDFKGADAAWDRWLASKGLKDPLKPVFDALAQADQRLDQALADADREWDEADRKWGLKK